MKKTFNMKEMFRDIKANHSDKYSDKVSKEKPFYDVGYFKREIARLERNPNFLSTKGIKITKLVDEV